MILCDFDENPCTFAKNVVPLQRKTKGKPLTRSSTNFQTGRKVLLKETLFINRCVIILMVINFKVFIFMEQLFKNKHFQLAMIASYMIAMCYIALEVVR